MKERRPYQWMYRTRLWRLRRERQLVTQPLCELCMKRSEITVAVIAHHIAPHKGKWELFINGTLQSLCKQCHDSDMQMLEKSGQEKITIGLDGWPVEK